MIRIILSVFMELVIILIVITYSTTLIVMGEVPQKPKATTIPKVSNDSIEVFDSAYNYWFFEMHGDITRIIFEDEQRIIFEVRSMEGSYKGQIDKSLLKDNRAKTKGAMEALRSLIISQEITYPQIHAHKQYYDKNNDQLKKITGQNFTLPNEWRDWYEENKNKLVWSDEKDHLIIEQESH